MQGAQDETRLKQELEDIQKHLSKKTKFEQSVSSLSSLLSLHYPSASPSLQKQFYTVVCRVATILKTRYTSPGFWLAGLRVFEVAESLVSDQREKDHLRGCVSQAREYLDQSVELESSVSGGDRGRGGYLFEGHLTVDPEPPVPNWLVLQSAVLNGIGANLDAGGNGNSNGDGEDHLTSAEATADMIRNLVEDIDISLIPEIFEGDASTARKVPPASKEVVAKLPVITLTKEVLDKLEKDVKCAICQENLVLGDKMQELPCKHTFHPPCLKPWLDEHNSCPICRHELQTDDHDYESWKERQKELEEERKGAENAIRGGEYMYV